MNVDCVIGIDCGSQGGIAVFRQGLKPFAVKMPRDTKDLLDFLSYYTDFRTLVFLEKVQLRPDDVMYQEGSANLGKMYRMQQLLANFEQVKTLLQAAGLPFCLVHPQKWISALGLRRTASGQREDKKDRKARYKHFASVHYPEVKTTLWNADALCLVHFGRLMLGTPKGVKWIESNLPKKEQEKLL